MSLAHQVCAELRKFSFAEVRKALEKFLAGDEGKNSVSEKLQLFVIVDLVLTLPSVLSFLLTSLGTVSDRLFDDCPPAEVIAQSVFQCRDFAFFHRESEHKYSCVAYGSTSRTCLLRLLILGRGRLPRSSPAIQLIQAVLFFASRFAGGGIRIVFREIDRLLNRFQGLRNLVLHVLRDRQPVDRYHVGLLRQRVDRFAKIGFRVSPVLILEGNGPENEIGL